MKIYVAARFDNKEEAIEAMHRFWGEGHEISYDWTVHEGAEYGAEASRQAMLDLGGVATADVFVLLASENMRGAFIELGVAMALYKRIYVVNSPGNTIFYSHPLIHHVKSIDEVINKLRGL